MNTASCFENTKNWFILPSRRSIAASTSRVSKRPSIGPCYQRRACDNARNYAVAAVAGRGSGTPLGIQGAGLCSTTLFSSTGQATTPSLNGLAAASDRGYNGGTMFSISKFLGHDEKFYDLLEASAQQADSSVHHLIDLLAKLEKSESTSDLAAFAESRREDKRITQQLTEELSKTFITPLEGEDIQALASALYKIPKTVEKIGERILICPEDLHGRSFRRQVELLDQRGRSGAGDGQAIAERH